MEALQLGLQALHRHGLAAHLQLGGFDVALQLATAGRQRARGESLLLLLALQRTGLLAGLGELALGLNHALFQLGMALLSIRQLQIKLFEAGLAGGAAFIKRLQLRVDLAQFVFDLSPPGVAGLNQLLKAKGASVNGFALFVVGEGIEKKQSDFAAEVAAAAATRG